MKLVGLTLRNVQHVRLAAILVLVAAHGSVSLDEDERSSSHRNGSADALESRNNPQLWANSSMRAESIPLGNIQQILSPRTIGLEA